MNKRIEELQQVIKAAQEAIRQIQERCPHDWHHIRGWNDGDGYAQSQQTVNYYYTCKCLGCGLIKDFKA